MRYKRSITRFLAAKMRSLLKLSKSLFFIRKAILISIKSKMLMSGMEYMNFKKDLLKMRTEEYLKFGI